MTALQQFLAAPWRRLAPREQTTLRMALAAGAVLGLWALLLAPALRTLHQAPAQDQILERQWQDMQRLQALARVLQAQPKSSRDALVRSLERTLSPLGPGAQLQVSGDQLTLRLRQVPAGVLADWLVESRNQVRMPVSEVRLTRNAAAATAVWSGTLVYSLPPG